MTGFPIVFIWLPAYRENAGHSGQEYRANHTVSGAINEVTENLKYMFGHKVSQSRDLNKHIILLLTNNLECINYKLFEN